MLINISITSSACVVNSSARFRVETLTQGIETYVKDVDLSFTPEAEASRYFVYPESYQSNAYQCGGECCGGDNGCSMSSADVNRETLNAELSNETKNMLK